MYGSTWDDTIIALATPPGVGAIGVIRISGSRTFDIVNALFPSKDLQGQPSHTILVGLLQYKNQVIDEVVLSLFRGPRSYTGEDVIEISCHGSPFIQQQVIQTCVEAGARLARPGEFTQRAFLNGKLDLAQAEAVADLIASSTEVARDTALHAMRGGFSIVLANLRQQMIRFSALIELELDFSQEDVEFADRTQFYQLLSEATTLTQRLMNSFKYGNVLKNGVRVAIVGKPNVGKSTLLNNFLNENRAIVSDIAGTTRDTIEEILNIDGILFRLIDTAGIREHTSDVIEQAGITKTKEKIQQADIIIYMFDASDEDFEEVLKEVAEYDQSRLLLIGNKTDEMYEKTYIIDGEEVVAMRDYDGLPSIFQHEGDRVKFISAKEGEGLDEVRKAMVQMVFGSKAPADDTIVTNARHFDALRMIDKCLTDILAGLDAGVATDLLALDVRRCLHYLGEITGEITNDDQLDYIFSKFCIGK
ncbi:MAG TPA: tRNA uridine-5-carboxymethylaminomethyl(34) synthesis GTPase MnmE [Chryseolinea sp.]|nr:tRNA uridine-5-carboxymethylaminomethyl(34) synthesis GTPase MnmE [Chryseolinea sp.]